MTLIGREISVVGGGVAGLTVARALALRGAAVTLYEQAPQISEVGAGIQVSPNGGRVLEALGLGPAFEAASGESGAVTLRDETGAQVLRMDLAGRGRFGLVHRADLIGVLEEGAREAGVQILTDRCVASVDLTGARPLLEVAQDGPVSADLLIGADGVQSRVRAALLGERPPEFTGHVAWRALVPAPGEVPREAQVFMAPGQHVVAYPLRNGALLNLMAVEERSDWVAEGWHHAGDPDELRRRFSAMGGPVREWLGQVTQCMFWGLFKHPVAERWHGKGAVLLGDAAHPTLPFLAQGACMALEDAFVLARALAEHDTDAAALAAYQSVRDARVRRIVDAATANAKNYHLGGAKRRVAHAGLRVIDRTAPARMLARFDWLYGHDVTV